MNGLINKTHSYTAYKRLTSDIQTHRWKMTGWKKIFLANGNQKKAWYLYLY